MHNTLKKNHLFLKLAFFGLVLASTMALVSCQKDIHPSRFELSAEGFSAESKMTVNDLVSRWSNGDQVRIGNASYSVSVEDSRAYVNDVQQDNEYCAVFPASIVSGPIYDRAGALVLPDTYMYEKESTNQKLASPMMAYLTGDGGGRMEFKHLTGAIVVQVKNQTGTSISLDHIQISSDNEALCGTMTLDFGALGTSTAPAAGDGTNRTVSMLFNGTTTIANNASLDVQIPLRAYGSSKLTIRVEAHDATNKIVFERSQTSNAGLARNELGYASATIQTAEGSYTTFSPRLTEISSGIYGVGTLAEWRAMVELLSNNNLNPNNWRTQTYQLTADIDATGYTMAPIANTFTGTLDGNNHEVKNLTIDADRNGDVSLFRGAANQTVKNIKMKDLTLHSNINNSNLYAAAFYSYPNNTSFDTFRLNNCSVDGLTVDAPWAGTSKVGGLIGNWINSKPFVISNCTVKNRITVNIGTSGNAPLAFGGLVGGLSYTPTHRIENCSVENIDVDLDYANKTVYAGGMVGDMSSGLKVKAYDNSVSGTMTVRAGANSLAGDFYGRIYISTGSTIYWITDEDRPNSSTLVINRIGFSN